MSTQTAFVFITVHVMKRACRAADAAEDQTGRQCADKMPYSKMS